MVSNTAFLGPYQSRHGFDMYIFGFLKSDMGSEWEYVLGKHRASIGIRYVSNKETTLILKCHFFIKLYHK